MRLFRWERERETFDEGICLTPKTGEDKLRLSELQSIADKVCNHFGLPKVMVEFTSWIKSKLHGRYCGGEKKIKISLTSPARTLAHELGHHLTDTISPSPIQHPAEFWYYYGRVSEFLGRPLTADELK